LEARGFQGAEGDLEGVDHVAGAAGVNGVLGQAVDDRGQGDEDADAVFDDRDIHACDFGIDENAVAAFGVFEVVMVAIIFAFECRRAAALAGWGLVVVAVVVAADVWNRIRHGAPWVCDFCMIFQTNHLPDGDFAGS